MQLSSLSFALALALLVASPVSTDALTLRKAAAGSPVERVVTLLTDLKEKLLMDEKGEQKVYDKYACWCEKTTARKAEAITDANNDLRAFGQTILSLKGKIATLAFEIEELETNIKLNKEAQEQATTIRQKENAAFVADTTELKQAISAMEKAVTVLVEGSSSLLQAEAKAKIKAVVAAIPSSKSLKAEQLTLLSEYMRSGYAPQSMTVQGILKDMYETFTADLESATQAEATANTNFEAFIATKTEELHSMEKSKAEKEAEKAESEQRLADTQALYDDTEEQKKADINFFDVTKDACTAKHDAWEVRSSLREEEVAGITKALEIFTSDAARELFASSIKAGKETGMDSRDTGRDIAPAFLQLGSPVAKAYAALKESASASHSVRLAMLASKVRSAKVGHFDEVLASIEKMIQMLTEENDADIAKRDQCKDEYQKIESTAKDLNWKIEKNEAKIEKLTKLIELRTQQLAETVASIEEVDLHMKTITEERTAENAAFLKAKNEDQQAIDLLMEARKAFTAFYAKNKIEMGPIQGSVKGAAFAQVFGSQEPEFAVSDDQAPDAVFNEKGARKGESKGIVSILTMIIEDLNDEIKNGMKNEEASQVDYEEQMDTAEKLREELIAKKVSLEEAIAKRNEEKSAEIEDMNANQKDLDDEIAYKNSITPDCDWIIGAFEKRAVARTSEMEGLSGAKDFLAGAAKA